MMKVNSLLVLVFFINGLFFLEAQNFPKMIKVEGGTFTMGDNLGLGEANERPTHNVKINTFYISETEITVAQYRTYCKAENILMPDEPYWELEDDQPIVNVTWNDAIGYTKWLSNKLGRPFRLPYEAEWEYAARGGNKSKGYKYSGTNNINDVWFEDNSGERAQSVASKIANELGIYDMSGNALEWCMDRYDKDYYNKSSVSNPKGAIKGDRRVLRGGGWYYRPIYCRITQRTNSTPDYQSYVFGFRIATSQ
ncbi:hypothetical protein D7030_02170 [Flavobacteriaceae bacterium AU392]|nr:hypothetical protein D1817_08645 [Flavobacteriaceae bacterium]RKM85503.1 hypothetical protein D7030_02170 [Flavobacteriaceae bacterium AU392]